MQIEVKSPTRFLIPDEPSQTVLVATGRYNAQLEVRDIPHPDTGAKMAVEWVIFKAAVGGGAQKVAAGAAKAAIGKRGKRVDLSAVKIVD